MKVKVKINIHDLLKEHNISLRELSLLTDIGHDKLSPLANQQNQRIQFSYIERIAEALEITDIRKIIDINISED
jgi:putative transcriptional regulator